MSRFVRNHVELVGNLTRDPELVKVGDTVKCRFGLAVSKPDLSEKDETPAPGKPGRPTADFADIVTWGRLAEVCHAHLSKGRSVFVDARYCHEVYDHNGERRDAHYFTAYRVQFLGPKKKAEAEGEAAAGDEATDEIPTEAELSGATTD